MFDALKNLGNLPSLMAKARDMQERMATLQEELANKTVSAEVANGVIKATVNGKLELIQIRIDKDRLSPSDADRLEDLIVAAVRSAQAKASEMVGQEMAKATSGLGLPPGMIPGM